MGQVILWQPITHILWKEQILLGKVRSIGFCHVQNCHILPVGFNANQGLKIEYSDTLLGSYLFRAYLRRLNRFTKRELLVGEAVRQQVFLSRGSWDPRQTLEMKILVD